MAREIKLRSSMQYVDFKNDRDFEIKSLADLTIWDWYIICARLRGFAFTVINNRFTNQLNVIDRPLVNAFSCKIVKRKVEALIGGQLKWDPLKKPNILAWLMWQVKEEISETLPADVARPPCVSDPSTDIEKPRTSRRGGRGRGGRRHKPAPLASESLNVDRTGAGSETVPMVFF